MSSNSISQLFKKKAAKLKSELGAVCSDKGPYFDGPGDRYVQLFEHGVILGNMKKLTMDKNLICVYGKLFHTWWPNKDAGWLGKPLEDTFKKKDKAGHDIMVQRFENGVIWCRTDGGDDVRWLSWHDWHAISKPKDFSDKHP